MSPVTARGAEEEGEAAVLEDCAGEEGHGADGVTVPGMRSDGAMRQLTESDECKRYDKAKFSL